MVSSPEQPWSDHEKNHLLAEIIKASNPQPGVLYDIISRYNIQPRWDDIPLPSGRSLNSSRFAYENLRRSMRPPVGTSMGPQTPSPLTAPIPALKRPYGFEPANYPAIAGPSSREIRPKPSAAGSPMPQPTPTEPPQKRKRGRPTKAEALAKAEAAAGSGSGGGGGSSGSGGGGVIEAGLSSVARRAPSATYGPVTSSQTPDVKPPAPTTSGMTIAAMLTPTQGTQKPASQSGSSSGKRRRARSMKSEAEEDTDPAASASRPPYDSPYLRAGETTGSPEDTPARAAVLRHRDEQRQSPQATPIDPGASTGSLPPRSPPRSPPRKL